MIKYRFNGIKPNKRSGCSSCRKGRSTSTVSNKTSTSIVLSDGRVQHLKIGDVFNVSEADVQMIDKMNRYSASEVYSRVT